LFHGYDDALFKYIVYEKIENQLMTLEGNFILRNVTVGREKSAIEVKFCHLHAED